VPAGLSNPAVGYAAFSAIKFAGYTIAAHYISRSYDRSDLAAWRVGATRTLIGMTAGALYFGLWIVVRIPFPQLLNTTGEAFPFLYLAGLLPVRLLEWWLLIWIFYDRALIERAKGLRTVALGTAWSCLLDIPAVAGLITIGGFWVC
jgi:hypothetical protein